MKKLIAMFSMVLATSVFADSATLEFQNITGKNSTSPTQGLYALSVKHNFNANWAGDVVSSVSQTDKTNATGAREEVGVSYTQPLNSKYTFGTRVSVGQKLTNTIATGYYTVEPSVSTPVGPFTAKVGYRFRTATNDTVNDTTHASRFSLAYPLTKQDTVGVRFDRITGDLRQDVWAFNYTRTF
jgi:hypothetical protein